MEDFLLVNVVVGAGAGAFTETDAAADAAVVTASSAFPETLSSLVCTSLILSSTSFSREETVLKFICERARQLGHR